MFGKAFYRNSGSVTVEASIIVPTIIFILIALIYSFMILFQNAVLIKTADSAAQQAAEVWTDSRKDIKNGWWDQKSAKDSLYSNLFDTSFSYSTSIDLISAKKPTWSDTGNRKLVQMLDFIYSGLLKSLLKSKRIEVNVNYKNNLVEGNIEVTVTQEIKIPLGWLKSFFDGKSTMTLVAKGTAIVAQPAEFIRNVDLALEYVDKLKGKLDFNGMIDGLKSKLQKKTSK